MEPRFSSCVTLRMLHINDIKWLKVKLKPWAINITGSTTGFIFALDDLYTAKLLNYNEFFFQGKRRQIQLKPRRRSLKVQWWLIFDWAISRSWVQLCLFTRHRQKVVNLISKQAISKSDLFFFSLYSQTINKFDIINRQFINLNTVVFSFHSMQTVYKFN